MDFQEYAEWTDKLWSNIGDSNEHALLGMFGELGEIADCKKKVFYGREVDVNNLKEEAGDFMYYAARIYRQNIPNAVLIIDIYPMSISVIDLLEITRNVQEIAEGVSFEDTTLISGGLERSINKVLGICNEYSLTYDEIIACNIAKLEARYNKGKFDAEDATTNRNKDAERKVIEQSGIKGAGQGDGC